MTTKANGAQEGQDWLLSRVGCFTASRASKLMAKTRTGYGASRGELLTLLAIERITGQPVPTYQNAAMQRGIETEAEARDAYSFETGNAVEECGFIPHPTVPNCGASPDGLIGGDGLLEIKCPANMEKHLEALLYGSHAKEYAWQLQHQLWVTGRKWVDACSYDPRYPTHLQQAVTRVVRDEKAIAELAAEVDAGERRIAEIIAELNELKQKGKA